MKNSTITTEVDAPTLGWSNFALSRHKPGTGYSFFTCSTADVIDLVRRNWCFAIPGDGETNLQKKVVVPIPAENFYSTSVPLKKDMVLHSDVYQHNSDFAIRTVAKERAVPAKFVNVVCFSADTIQQSFGARSCDLAWEIIVILATQSKREPMHFLSMARNLLERPSEAEGIYTAREFAESIHYWSQRVQVKGEE